MNPKPEITTTKQYDITGNYVVSRTTHFTAPTSYYVIDFSKSRTAARLAMIVFGILAKERVPIDSMKTIGIGVNGVSKLEDKISLYQVLKHLTKVVYYLVRNWRKL